MESQALYGKGIAYGAVSIPVEGKCYGKGIAMFFSSYLHMSVSIPVEGKCYGKSLHLERLQGEGSRPPNRHTPEKWKKFSKKPSILQPEKLAAQGIDTLQRNYAVFKVRVECVDEFQRT